MTKTEKEIILGLAYRYDKAAGLDHDDPEYRTIGHFDSMLTLLDLLDLKDEYYDYEPTKMKPDIIKKPYEARAIKGYVVGFCKCGNVLHVKNAPERAMESIVIECPCGSEIQTMYARE